MTDVGTGSRSGIGFMGSGTGASCITSYGMSVAFSTRGSDRMSVAGKTVVERLSSAMVSDDLAVHEYRSDVDYLIALGAAGQGKGWAASALARVRLGADAASLKSATKAAIQVARKMNMKRAWSFGDGEIRQLAAVAIRHFVNPVCPCCHGRRYDVIDGTPTLSDRSCQRCNGSGVRPVADHSRRVTSAHVALLLAALQAMEGVLLHEVRKKLD